jgi:SARP family transcriptional regulator, regulator of embCAB operon
VAPAEEVGRILASARPFKAQICGRVALEVDGRRVERELRGRQGRVLIAYLAANRRRPVGRGELIDALWGECPPPGADGALRVLLSRLRRVLGEEVLPPQGEVQLRLPRGAWIDLEAARDAIHRAESALALGQWERAWGAAQVAMFTARRGFLPGEEAPWIEELRRELDDLYVRALECYGRASLEIGGTELAAAERCGHELVSRSPYRESGHRLLMRTLMKAGNSAQALQVYEDLRLLLRRELGIAPSARTRELHTSLLHEDVDAAP